MIAAVWLWSGGSVGCLDFWRQYYLVIMYTVLSAYVSQCSGPHSAFLDPFASDRFFDLCHCSLSFENAFSSEAMGTRCST